MNGKRTTRRKATAPGNAEDARLSMEEAKRSVIDNLESLRGAQPVHRMPAPADLPARSREELEQEVIRLRTELKHLRASSALQEHDMHRLEQKALEAISEAGHLRQSLDRIRAHHTDMPGTLHEYIEERNDLLLRVEAAEQERVLLATALQDSEREIARLAKNLDQFTRKYCDS